MQNTDRTIYRKTYDTPIGPVLIEASDTSIIGLRTENADYEQQTGEALSDEFPSDHRSGNAGSGSSHIRFQENTLIKKTYDELMEYFSGERFDFDLPVHAEGTEFQMQVWEALKEIPYGETRSYKEIAIKIGRPKACRAVGGACHRNPVFILIPCHRVIGSNGSMTGFGGGIPVKEQLLSLEKTARK